jgi:hypothetical protein
MDRDVSCEAYILFLGRGRGVEEETKRMITRVTTGVATRVMKRVTKRVTKGETKRVHARRRQMYGHNQTLANMTKRRDII